MASLSVSTGAESLVEDDASVLVGLEGGNDMYFKYQSNSSYKNVPLVSENAANLNVASKICSSYSPAMKGPTIFPQP